MITPFSQSKVTYKISFYTKYSSVDLFDELPIEDILSISTYEIESKTIDAAPDDIWRYEIYLSAKPNFSLIKKQILDFASNHNIDIPKDIIIEKVEDRDWVSFYQSQLKPFEIGKFFISSNLHQNLCPKDKIGIFIEASRAFGTGSHETTSGCVEALEFLSSCVSSLIK
ncbi:MAG: 50S ribosomal protein L11 methyltransferase [Candidatus Rickettsia vulgarisii]